MEHEYVLPSGQHNLSHRRGRPRLAARLQMAGDCCWLAAPMWLSAAVSDQGVFLAYEGLQIRKGN